METYLDQAPCLYFSATDDGRLIDVNSTLCAHLGYRKEELIGQKLEQIFTLATRIFQQTHLFPLLKMQGHAEEIFITLQTKTNDHVPLLMNVERKPIKEQPVIVHIGIVVQNRKRFEDELIAARKAAEAALHENTALLEARQQLQKHAEHLDQQIHVVKKQNEELKQFNRVVTHDLQEPIRKLSLFSSMLLEDGSGEHQIKAVKKLVQVSEQMRLVISGLQQYIWLTEVSIKPDRVDLNQMISAAESELKKEWEDILIVERTELPFAIADAEQMRILFYQLLSNVIRFRRPGNRALVRITANKLLLNRFRNIEGKYKYTEFLKLQLKDEGIGFDAVYRDQVFELFKRLHSESGRGIGLSLCKKIIENHQGDISIDSSEGKGTTVTVVLPDQPV